MFRIQLYVHYLIIKIFLELFVIVIHPHLIFPQCHRSSFHHVSSSNFFFSKYFFFLAKPPRDSGYESIGLLKQQQHVNPGRPLSLSISTATTYTSSGTDSSSSPLPPPLMNTFRPPYSSFKYHIPISSVVRLAEEEKMDVWRNFNFLKETRQN